MNFLEPLQFFERSSKRAEAVTRVDLDNLVSVSVADVTDGDGQAEFDVVCSFTLHQLRAETAPLCSGNRLAKGLVSKKPYRDTRNWVYDNPAPKANMGPRFVAS